MMMMMTMMMHLPAVPSANLLQLPWRWSPGCNPAHCRETQRWCINNWLWTWIYVSIFITLNLNTYITHILSDNSCVECLGAWHWEIMTVLLIKAPAPAAAAWLLGLFVDSWFVACSCTIQVQIYSLWADRAPHQTNMAVWPRAACCHSVIQFHSVLLRVFCVAKGKSSNHFEGNVAQIRSDQIKAPYVVISLCCLIASAFKGQTGFK